MSCRIFCNIFLILKVLKVYLEGIITRAVQQLTNWKTRLLSQEECESASSLTVCVLIHSFLQFDSSKLEEWSRFVHWMLIKLIGSFHNCWRTSWSVSSYSNLILRNHEEVLVHLIDKFANIRLTVQHFPRKYSKMRIQLGHALLLKAVFY